MEPTQRRSFIQFLSSALNHSCVASCACDLKKCANPNDYKTAVKRQKVVWCERCGNVTTLNQNHVALPLLYYCFSKRRPLQLWSAPQAVITTRVAPPAPSPAVRILQAPVALATSPVWRDAFVTPASSSAETNASHSVNADVRMETETTGR